MFRRVRQLLRFLFRSSRVRAELDEEMSFHIQCLTDDLIRGGMEPRAARKEAALRFGSRERVQSKTREVRGMALVDETARNLRFAVRGMVRNPLFSSTFVLTLALCIGLGTAVFSVVDAVLWRALPFPNPDQLAHAALYDPAVGKIPGNTAVDGRTWERIRDEGGFVDRAAYSRMVAGVNLSTDQAAAFVDQQRVGAAYFRTLGVVPRLGREFDSAEDIPGGPPVAILSHDLWSGTFLRDPDVIGQTIRLKGEAHTVVGVMPEGFQSPGEADLWTPLQPTTGGEGVGTNYAVLVRVPDEMTLEEADARLATILPPSMGGSEEDGAPQRRFGLVALDAATTAGLRLPLMVLLGAIGLMLVVGCANLAGLQIARFLARRGEMATRQALGSGTGALARQMVVENVVLGLLGGVIGVAICFFAVEGLEALVRSYFHTWQEVRLDARALMAALGLTAVATTLFGLAPILQLRKAGVAQALVSGTRGVVGKEGHLLRKFLLVGEVTVVTALLFAAGLLLRSYGHLEGLNPGFESEGVLTFQFSLDDARYAESAEVQRLFQETLTRIRDVPGVASASVALTLPYERPLNLPIRRPGDEEGTNRLINAVYVTPGFFETLGIPVLRGRTFDEGDRSGTPLVVVANQSLVETHYDGEDALGEQIRSGLLGEEPIEIVGVVGNVLHRAGWGLTGTAPLWETPTIYLSSAQASDDFLQLIHVWFSPSWIVRGSASHPDLAGRVAQAVREVDVELPVARLASLKEIMDEAFARERFQAAFLLVVSAFALILAGIGLYGIVAHEVLERRAEMGLRMALGATPGKAVWVTGVSGVILTGVGLALGGALAIPTGRVMVGMIYGVRPFDPVTLAGLAGVLLILAVLASFIPAAKIGRTDPAEILREG